MKHNTQQIEDAKEAAVMKATTLLEVAMQTKVDVIPIGEIFIELFDAGYAAARSDGWICVENRLPETPNPWPVQVWVCIRIANVELYDTAKCYKAEWMDSSGNLIEAPAVVIAWMPISPFQPLSGEKL